MKHLPHLFSNNRAWAAARLDADPEYFKKLAGQQTPSYLWIGCADSRVPANEIVGLPPGELFVHRNVANIVVHTDLNCLSVLEFAVRVLRVPHIIVCGHYGCGGVVAAWRRRPVGLVDNWLRHVEDVAARHRAALDAIGEEADIIDRLCELNVLEQAVNVSRTSVVQEVWRAGQELSVHSWIYGISDGLLRDLGFTVTGPGEVAVAFEAATNATARGPA